MKRALAWLTFSLLLSGPALAERLASSLSSEEISITSSFDGEQLSLFGNVEPDVGAPPESLRGPYHVIVVVEGPLGSRVARRKTNEFGIWINTEQVLFQGFPSFFHVLSSGRLADISDPVTLSAEGILPEQHAMASAQAGWWNSALFSRELVRLMEDKGHFGIDTAGVRFLSRTAYTARVALPSDITNGLFVAQTYLFRGGAVVARKTESFSVRKIGFERFIAVSATQQPLLYGLVCVGLALFTGWLGGVVFRR